MFVRNKWISVFVFAVVAIFLTGCAGETERGRLTYDNEAFVGERDAYLGEMETRLNNLEARYKTWAERNPNSERATYLRSEIDELREDVNELRNTTYENWWSNRRAAMDREVGELEGMFGE